MLPPFFQEAKEAFLTALKDTPAQDVKANLGDLLDSLWYKLNLSSAKDLETQEKILSRLEEKVAALEAEVEKLKQ